MTLIMFQKELQLNANEIMDKSNIFKYKDGFNKGSYAGFADSFKHGFYCFY